MLREFKDFALRGNLVELAVAFVLGTAFAAVVGSLVGDVIMNLIAAIFGKPDFSDLTFSVGDGTIFYGRFLTKLTTFLVIALALFLIATAVKRLMSASVTTKECPHCLTAIPVAAGVCSACTRDVPRTAAA
ncbi:MAG: large conductance mechanosensitive channel protein MscL [Thermoleophilaceae bacterium]|jgi:large conductance mechanosensitive channel|nr:large conductance mechanosensitive channel protein MscL [Thermoleophilaceae bacterium]